MAGIYIHIPFCRQACHYCNFHFSTSANYRQEMVDCIVTELAMQRDYLNGAEIESVYFGGGTPSMLSVAQIAQIFAAIDQHFTRLPTAECTLEANPDDLSEAYLAELASQGCINRLSIGTQSFFDTDLQYLNRVHSAQEAQAAIRRAKSYGFEVLTIDLIYGVPTCSDEQWRENIHIALSLGVSHLSCYALTVEPKTALEHLVKKGKVLPLDEQQAARQFEILMDETALAGFEHYEISNFCKPPHYAVHNGNYWKMIPYLGLGPSAHSFNGHSRQWNIANNALYIKSIEAGSLPAEQEILSLYDQVNERIMVGLRTQWGLDLQQLESLSGAEITQQIQQGLAKFEQQGLVIQSGSIYRLSRSGKLLADHVMSELFVLAD